MAFFAGNLVVSVSGCCIDEKAGPLRDPCVELSVGNKLHSTSLPIEIGAGGRRARETRERNPSVAFHGVTEEDVLTVTVLDRSSSPTSNGGEAFVAEAEPLLATDWGPGGRPARRTCVVVPLEEVMGFRGDEAGEVLKGRREGERRRGVSTVQLAICWSPAIRLRKPLSVVAKAGNRTGRVISRKIDRPVAALLNAAFGVWGYSAGFLQHPTWGAAATVASVASLSLGTTVLVAVAAFFLPVTVALVAAAATLALPAAAVGWVVACTRPACEQLWRPMLVWVGTRSGLMRRVLLFPLDQGGHAEELGGEVYGVLVGEEAAVVEGAGEEPAPVSGELPQDFAQRSPVNAEDRSDRDRPDAGAVFLLLACCQNLVAVLHTGLDASRWQPRQH